MRVFITVLVFIFSLQSWTKADSIKDFQIEGISIGDSLLDFLPENKIIKDYYIGNKYFRSVLLSKRDTDFPNPIDYDVVFGIVESSNSSYNIESVNGFIMYEDINNCFKEMKNVNTIISQLFPKVKKNNSEKNHPEDPTKKSKIYQTTFLVSNDGVIKVACLDMSVATGKLDTLAVVIRTLKYDRWFENEY